MADKFADKLQKIEDGVVGAYQKVENKFVDTFVAKEGETTEEAKERMLKKQNELDAKMKAAQEERMTSQNERIKKSIESSKNAGKR